MGDFKDITADALQSLERDTSVRSTVFLAETASTNTHALRLLSDAAPSDGSSDGSPAVPTLPMLIYTARQTAGRGRGANRWWSQTGSLTFSLLIDTANMGIEPRQQPQASLLAALSVASACEALVPNTLIKVKWPNDVYLQGRKLAGILIESSAASPSVLVVGIGINVNISRVNGLGEIRNEAISLADVAESTIDPLALLRAFLLAFDSSLLQFAHDSKALPAAWPARCLLSGKAISLAANGLSESGVCRGIDADGSLLLETSDGIKAVRSATVTDWHER